MLAVTLTYGPSRPEPRRIRRLAGVFRRNDAGLSRVVSGRGPLATGNRGGAASYLRLKIKWDGIRLRLRQCSYISGPIN